MRRERERGEREKEGRERKRGERERGERWGWVITLDFAILSNPSIKTRIPEGLEKKKKSNEKMIF